MENKFQKIWLFNVPMLFIFPKIVKFHIWNIGEISWVNYCRPLLLIVMFNIVLSVSFYFICKREVVKSCLVSCVFVILNFSFGKFNDAVDAFIGVGTSNLLRLVLFNSLVFICLFITIKLKKVPLRIGTFLSVCGSVTLIMSLIPLFQKKYIKSPNTREFVRFGNLNDVNKQDIYIVILDAYARADKINEIYGGDGYRFVNDLRKRGFFVAENSMSNYERTKFSVPSFLNMNYVDDINFSGTVEARSSEWAERVVQENVFMECLRRIGYHIYTVNSGVRFTHIERSEILYSPWSSNLNLKKILFNPDTPIGADIRPIESYIFERTMLSLFHREITDDEIDKHRNHILRSFDAFEKSVRNPGPKVVFTHILLPHPPFVFDRNGNFIFPINSEHPKDHLKPYVEQADFAAKKIMKAITAILEKDPSSIIVVVGDHGGRSYLDQKNFEKTNLQDCFPNLVAIHAPKIKFGKQYEYITLVNVLRLILREYFDPEIPLLDNRQYYGTKELLEVTDKVRASTRE